MTENATAETAGAREYVILIIGDADRWWSTWSMKEREDGYAEYERFSAELIKRGHEITGGAELHASKTARSIAKGGGAVTEGPYAELAEQVGGFYMVRSSNLDDLMDCCQIIANLGDGIEVRPTVSEQERG